MTTEGRTGAVPGKAGEFAKGQPVPPSVSSKAAPRRGEVPYSIEAERSVLAGILLDEAEAWRVGIDRLITAEDFFMPEHTAIYRAMEWCRGRGKPITSPCVASALSAMGVIDDVDRWLGPPWTEPYLVELCGNHLAPTWLETHAGIVKEYAERRAQIEHGQALVREAYEGPVKRRLGGVRID